MLQNTQSPIFALLLLLASLVMGMSNASARPTMRLTSSAASVANLEPFVVMLTANVPVSLPTNIRVTNGTGTVAALMQ